VRANLAVQFRELRCVPEPLFDRRGPEQHDYPWRDEAMCVNAAGKAVSASGLSGITATGMATGGHTATTRGYIVCIRLPKAGACNGDGATAVLVTAGSDAKALLDTINKNLKTPVMIDCG
jgi:hypothetical protein